MTSRKPTESGYPKSLNLRFLHRAAGAPGEKKLLILLHGLGSNEQDLFGFGSHIPAEFEFFSLRAPMDYYQGFKWFTVSVTDSGRIYDEAEARASVDEVATAVPEIQSQTGIGPENTVLGGFSQGAMISLGVALRHPQVASHFWLMSGALIPSLAPSPATERTLPLRALVQHGLYDDVISVERGKIAAQVLSELPGATVNFQTYPMGHTISDLSLRDGVQWLVNN